MNQGKRQCLSVLPTPPPTSTWVKWNVKEEGKRVRSWDGPRKWNSPYLTLDPGSSYLVLDFWRPKAAHSPGPSLTEALAKSGASVRNTTQSLFARNSLWRWSRRRCQMQEEETLSGKTSRVKWRLSWSSGAQQEQKVGGGTCVQRNRASENMVCWRICKLLGEPGNEGVRRKVKEKKQESLRVGLWSTNCSMLRVWLSSCSFWRNTWTETD